MILFEDEQACMNVQALKGVHNEMFVKSEWIILGYN